MANDSNDLVSISGAVTEITCLGNADGAIDVTVTGTGPFTYSWDNGETTKDLSGLGPGDYTITVTDTGNGNATATETFTIEPGFYLLDGANDNSKEVGCTYDNDGTLNIVINAGTGPYTYEWYDEDGNLIGDQNNLSGVTAGEYTLEASGLNKEGIRCYVTEIITIEEPDPIFTVSADITPVGCNGGTDGAIDLTVTSPNNGRIQYYWLTNDETTEDITVLAAGDYEVRISQGGHCEVHTFTVTQPDPIVISPAITDVLCNGGSSGAIDITVTGGSGSYTYSWDNGATTEDISNLPAGDYTITVTDENGCASSSTITVTEPSTLMTATASVTDVVCNGGSTGIIDITVNNATAPISYEWSNGATTEDLNNIPAGNYSVTITDNLGCLTNLNVTVTEPTPLELATTKTDIDCNGNTNGSIDLTVSGGVGPYTYDWSNGSSAEDLSNLSIGTYAVTVTDANGCTATNSVTITQPDPITLTTSKVDILCHGSSTGTIDLSVSGGSVGYSYFWNNGATTQDLNNVAAGTYTVTVTDANGCTETTSVTLTEPTEINLSSSVVDVTCKGQTDGSIDLSVSGGTGAYTYSWDNGATTEDISNLPAGDYTITVTDENGCASSSTITVTEPSTLMTATASVTDVVCNGGSTGIIDITVNNGTAPIIYEWSNGATTEDLNNIPAGNYSVTITDNLGCLTISNVTVTEPTPLELATTKTDIDCNGNTNGSIDLTVSGGVGPYTYDWSTGAITQDIDNLSAGLYTVIVTDNNGCTQNTSVTIVEPDALNLSISATDVSCNAGNDGAIDLTVTGGTAPYTYLWNSGQSVEDLSSIFAGTYSVTVTDKNGCTETTSVTINEPSAITINEAVTDAGCSGGSAGIINLSVSGGTAPYTYSWSNGATTEDINSLTFGSYTVTVTDATGCVRSKTIDINEDSSLSTTAVISNVDCNGNTNGEINLSVSGGTAPYDILWNTGSTDEDLTMLPAGNYDVIVTDAADCSTSLSVTITEPDALILNSTSVDILCADDNTGSINLMVSGGSAPYDYTWSNGETTQDISDLLAGTYTVTVRDDLNCESTLSVTITEPDPISLSTTQTDISCNGANDGTVDLSVSGGTGSYSYSWNNGETTQDLSGLSVGTYSVTVTDDNGCTASTSVTINEPAVLALSTSSTNVNCNGDATGSIDLTATGGTGAYSYSWNNGSATEDLTDITAGTYSVVVTDDNGCTASAIVTITQPNALSLSLSGNDVLCNGDATGAIDLTVNGGVGPFSYLWNNGENSEDLSNLSAGTYEVTVNDSNGCTVTSSITINEPTPISLSSSQTNVSCNGDATGSIDLSVSGGAVGYTYAWSNGETTQDLEDLSAGTYSVTVTDGNGCTSSTSMTITEPTNIILNTTSANVTCKGQSDGSIDLSVSGGTGSFSYSWDNGSTTQDLSNLGPGTYTVTVTDGNACTASATVTITEPPTLMTASFTKKNVTCNGEATGSIDLTVNDGAAPITYAWSNGATTEDLTNIEAGIYSVTITDNLGCIIVSNINITEPDALTVSAVKTDILCNGNDDGSIDISVSGGVAPYTYAWNNGQAVQDLNNLTAGTYSVTVTDSNNCTENISIAISEPTPLSLITAKTNVSCSGGTDGSISLSVAGGIGPYNYSWNNGETSQNLTGLSAGTYNVVVTDSNGCSENASVTINQPSTALTATVNVKDITCKGGNTGAIDLTVSGGTAPYDFQWSNGATSEDISSLIAGSYNVTISDNNNCLTINGITISEPASALSLNSANTNISCNGADNGIIDLTVTGGVAPYTYSWSNGASTEDLVNLPSGSYSVEVTDNNGCKISQSFNLSEPYPIEISFSTAMVSCFGAGDASIDASITGGTGAYTYSWNTGETNQDLTNIGPGNYSLTVTDENGCSSTASVNIVEPAEISISSTVNNVDCNGGTNGAIDVTITGGTAPFSYSWSNGENAEDINGLTYGTYTLTVTDANSCSQTTNIIVNEDSSMDLSLSQTNVSCNGGTDGSINLSLTGGVAPFTYLWNTGETTQDLNNLVAGTYSVVVTDANGCSSVLQTEIVEPEEISTISTSTDITCFGSTDGTIALKLSGGTAPYDITIDVVPSVGIQATVTDNNGCSNALFGIESNVADFLNTASATSQGDQLLISNLAAGTYNITRPNQGGRIVSTENISEPNEIVITETIANVSCNEGNDGSISLSTTGGTGNYTYTWSTGATTRNISNLSAGNYSVTVTDVNGCTQMESFVISEPNALTVSTDIENVRCFGGLDGSIALTPNGGTAPYTYSWSNGATTNTLNSLSAGNYEVMVTDANGCSISETYTITQPSQIEVSLLTTHLTCFESNDGSITANVSGGTGNYTYSWSNGGVSPEIQGLPAENYSLLVTDDSGCTAQVFVKVNQPDPLSITENIFDSSCFGADNGSIDIIVTGGTAPYTYNWNEGSLTEDISGLAPGNYSVNVTDANGCVVSANYQIIEPSELQISTTKQDVACFGSATGSIELLLTGGTGSYRVEWQDGTTGTVRQNLSAGQYMATVLDDNGCSQMVSVNILEPEEIIITPTINDVVCNGESNGAISLAVTGGIPPYTYQWSNEETSQDISGLSAGNYELSLTDANGCNVQLSVAVMEPNALDAQTIRNLNVDCENRFITETVSISMQGGTAPYRYSWDNESFSEENSNIYDIDGSYEVRILDANDCEIIIPFEVMLPELGTSNMNISGTQDPQGEYTFNTPIQFTLDRSDNIISWEWKLGDGTSSLDESFEHIYDELGSYLVTLTTVDANGCTLVHEETIVVDYGYEIVMPTAFTPNNDGLNDRIYPEFYGIEEMEIIYYNNWGEVVFVSEKIEDGGWNGLIDNAEAPSEGYAYKIKARSISGREIEQTGSFLLVRR